MESITLSKSDAEGLLAAVKKHEAARPGFTDTDYTDDEWSGITALIVALGRK